MLIFLPSAVVKLLIDGAFSYHPINAEFHVFYHELYYHSVLSLQKGITELVHEQMTNQLSASQALITAAIFSRSKAICTVGIRNRQVYWISKKSIDADAQM